uniref:hypothetical protein n=1 Tax=Roseivirga sp. TaxID=1964215 RepID=UPI0040489E31
MLSFEISSLIQGHSNFQNKVKVALGLKCFVERKNLTAKPVAVDPQAPKPTETTDIAAWELLKRRLDYFAGINSANNSAITVAQEAYSTVMSYLSDAEKLTDANTANKTVVEIIDDIDDLDIKAGVDAHWLTKL